MFWIIFGVVVSILIYIYVIKPMSYFKERNVPFERPLPLVGNSLNVLLRRKHFIEDMIDGANKFPGERFYGAFQFNTPVYVIKDLELVKLLGVKYFDHAMNHNVLVDTSVEPLFALNLFNLRDDKWREMRATLSPSFTSSKMKMMFILISNYAEKFVNFFAEKQEEIIEVELKEIVSKYTNDIIASIAFGLECDSLRNENNTFYAMGKALTNFNGLRKLRFILMFFPRIMKLFKMSMFPRDVTEFFASIIKETIEVRTKKGIVRPDMINLLMEARKGQLTHEVDDTKDEGFAVIEESEIGKKEIRVKRELSDKDIVAQALIFFFAGFETVSTLLSLVSHELAVHPDIQEKLIAEVEAAFNKDNNKITYETVMKMKYLDMVVSETLRFWPLAGAPDRVVQKALSIPASNPGERPLELRPGDILLFPAAAYHFDEKYFPNPKIFDPERFSDENKHKIVPYSYLPFGLGPRACIASRFALLETKILMVHLLKRFDIVKIKKTPDPLILDRSTFLVKPKNGFWLGLKLRS